MVLYIYFWCWHIEVGVSNAILIAIVTHLNIKYYLKYFKSYHKIAFYFARQACTTVNIPKPTSISAG